MLPRFRSNLLTGNNAIEFIAISNEGVQYNHSIDTRIVVSVGCDPREPQYGLLGTAIGTYRTTHTYQELTDLLYPHEE